MSFWIRFDGDRRRGGGCCHCRIAVVVVVVGVQCRGCIFIHIDILLVVIVGIGYCNIDHRVEGEKIIVILGYHDLHGLRVSYITKKEYELFTDEKG